MDAELLNLQSDKVGRRVDGPVKSGTQQGEEESFKTLFGEKYSDDELGSLFKVEALDTKSS